MGIETNKEFLANKEARQALKAERDALKLKIMTSIHPQTSYMPLFMDSFYITDNMKSKIRNTFNSTICNKEVVEMMKTIAEKLK